MAQPSESCVIGPEVLTKLKKGLKEAEWSKTVGCAGRTISTFDILGTRTDILEYKDRRKLLRVTFKNGAVLSYHGEGFDTEATGTIR